MSRGAIAAFCGVLLSVIVVVLGAVSTMRSSRYELEQQFAQGELVRAEEVARGLEEGLNEIGDHLRFLGPLLSTTESLVDCTRELRALLEVATQIRYAIVFDEAQRPVLEVPGRAAATLPGELQAELVAWAAVDPARSGSAIVISHALRSDASGWLRGFSLRVGDEHTRRRGTVILVVDTAAFSRASGLRSGAPSARALVLEPTGTPSPASDPTAARAFAAALPGSMIATLRDKLAEHEHGTLVLPASLAASLGLPSYDAIAAYSIAAPRDAAPWAVATVRSTASLREHERTIVLRLGLAAAGIALCLSAFAGYVVWASRRQVAMREQLRHADALAHLHEKTEKLLDNIPAIVVTLSDEQQITALNRSARARMPVGAVGGPLSAALPEAPAAVVDELLGLVALARSSGEVQSLFGRRIALFGEEGSFSLHAVPLEARFPEARAVLVLEDLSKVRSLETQLLRAEKLATVGVLAAGIAHEIGTPLSVVRGRAEYIRGKLEDAHPQRAGLDVIIGEIERVVRSVRQLLDFSHVRPAQVAPVSLPRIARGVGELLTLEAQRRKLTLKIDVPDELPPLSADADRLQQVLINLVMNAYDACQPGGHVELRASLAPNASPAGQRVRIIVRDDGVGVPPELRVQVFDPFFTTKKRGQGTGLGLAICAEIARDHDAEIELDAAPDGGTQVSLSWPIAAATVALGKGAA